MEKININEEIAKLEELNKDIEKKCRVYSKNRKRNSNFYVRKWTKET